MHGMHFISDKVVHDLLCSHTQPQQLYLLLRHISTPIVMFISLQKKERLFQPDWITSAFVPQQLLQTPFARTGNMVTVLPCT